MIKARTFLCNGAKAPESCQSNDERIVVELNSFGENTNVNIKIEDVTKRCSTNLTPRLEDLLEIAAFVYTADCATQRGKKWLDDDSSEPWDRNFKFIIPVRDLSFWNKHDVKILLTRILEFLSDGKYDFEFCEFDSSNIRSSQMYFQFEDLGDWPYFKAERVFMFSGGLDSLAGAVESANKGENLVLVSHRPVATLSKRQKELFDELQKKFNVKMIHIPVWVNKDKGLGREHLQRTRSFLFSTLGTIVAELIKAQGVYFFENGIVSLNFPVADEVLRARASRTTHPITLDYFSRLYSLITDRELQVENPYIFKTKSDIVKIIVENGGNSLIKYTCSCAHQGFFHSKTQWHCGTCSQCIDRRIAIVANKQENNDPEIDYISDVFVGPRKDGYEKNMAVGYIRHAFELYNMSENEMASTFNLEISRAIRHLHREAAQSIIDMHKHHAIIVYEVVKLKLTEFSGEVLNGTLDQSSMLSIIFGQQHLEPLWHRYSQRISQIISKGIPITCKTHKPEDEPHLQELCDGILKGNDSDLIREFPFMRWSSSLTKPDWSNEDYRLWVELKYVRKKADLRPITEDISADITKYGDNNRYILFLVYDPHHYISDEMKFAEPIIKRKTMMVNFIR